MQPTVRALLGSSSDEDTIALSRVSQADKMPIMGYKVETADLSDKVCSIFQDFRSFSVCAFFIGQLSPCLQATHPYFGRVSFSAGARFEAEAAFLQSHYWDKVVSHSHDT